MTAWSCEGGVWSQETFIVHRAQSLSGAAAAATILYSFVYGERGGSCYLFVPFKNSTAQLGQLSKFTPTTEGWNTNVASTQSWRWAEQCVKQDFRFSLLRKGQDKDNSSPNSCRCINLNPETFTFLNSAVESLWPLCSVWYVTLTILIILFPFRIEIN